MHIGNERRPSAVSRPPWASGPWYLKNWSASGIALSSPLARWQWDVVGLEVFGHVVVHRPRLVLGERGVGWHPAHEMEAVRVPVVPVVAALFHVVPHHPAG